MLLENPVPLGDVIDTAGLGVAIEAKYVRVQTHPTRPLRILNYTERCQFDNAWTLTTRRCRGLIIDQRDRIVARPFEKFFNYGQDGPTVPLDLAEEAVVTDKADGSLGILYPTGDPFGERWAIATRGSFASEQAIHATAVLREMYPGFEPPAGMTVLFEIVYPGNRIVVDYGGQDDLILLGAVDIRTGETVGPDWISGWDGPTVETFPYASLADALAAEPRPGAEGLVVYLPRLGKRIKIKQADYVALHRILTQTTARTVWEFLAVNACKDQIDPAKPLHWGSRLGLDPARAAEVLEVGDDWLGRLLEGVPDEFHVWLRTTIGNLKAEATVLRAHLYSTVERLRDDYGTDRKALAKAVGQREHFGAIYLLLDGRDITTYVWKAIYPEPGRPFANQTEDVA